MEMAGMLHGKVLRSPHAHALIRSIDTSAALGRWGRRRDPDRRRPRRHRALLRPRDQGSADRRDRPGALRRRAGCGRRGGGRGDGGSGSARDRGRVRGAAGARTRSSRRWRLVRRRLHERRPTDRPVPRPRRPRRAAGQRLLPPRDLGRRRRGDSRAGGDHRSRAPTRSRPSTSTRWRRTRRSPTTTATA